MNTITTGGLSLTSGARITIELDLSNDYYVSQVVTMLSGLLRKKHEVHDFKLPKKSTATWCVDCQKFIKPRRIMKSKKK